MSGLPPEKDPDDEQCPYCFKNIEGRFVEVHIERCRRRHVKRLEKFIKKDREVKI